MKKYIFVFLCTLCYTSTFSQVKTEYWNSKNQVSGKENKKSEGTFKDSLKDGKWTYWYENGNKLSEGEYILNNKTGHWTYWYSNGN
ncbi:MAG TPA: hypothetical protein PL028_04550, partial [Bacteroidales bacterium]|nr:hypothetical protein [Bacteroidales bacterium]